jgi:hypothetical protein
LLGRNRLIAELADRILQVRKSGRRLALCRRRGRRRGLLGRGGDGDSDKARGGRGQEEAVETHDRQFPGGFRGGMDPREMAIKPPSDHSPEAEVASGRKTA